METPNLSYIDKLSGGDAGFRVQIIDVLKQELPEEIDNYYQHMANNNLDGASQFVHRLKHKMSILGLEESYEITNTYENEMKNSGNLEKKAYFEEVLTVMKNFVESQ